METKHIINIDNLTTLLSLKKQYYEDELTDLTITSNSVKKLLINNKFVPGGSSNYYIKPITLLNNNEGIKRKKTITFNLYAQYIQSLKKWQLGSTLTINPIRKLKDELVHSKLYNTSFEKNTAHGENNYFHINGFKNGFDTSSLMDRYISKVNNLISLAEGRTCEELDNVFHQDLSKASYSLFNIKFKHIEVNIDTFINNSFLFHDTIRKVFPYHCINVQSISCDRQNKPLMKQSLINNSIAIEGALDGHTILRCYTKSIDIIRMELIFDTKDNCNKVAKYKQYKIEEDNKHTLPKDSEYQPYDFYALFEQIKNRLIDTAQSLFIDVEDYHTPITLTEILDVLSVLSKKKHHPCLKELFHLFMNKQVYIKSGKSKDTLYGLVRQLIKKGWLKEIAPKKGHYSPVGTFRKLISSLRFNLDGTDMVLSRPE